MPDPKIELVIDARRAKTGAQQFRASMDSLVSTGRRTTAALLRIERRFKSLQREMFSTQQQAQKTVRELSRFQKFRSGLNQIVPRGVGVVGGLGIGIGGAAIVNKIARQANAFQELQNRLRLVTDGTADLRDVTEELAEISDNTRSSLEGNAALFSRLAQSTKELDVSRGDLLTVTENLNKAIIISGATAQEAQAGLIQLSQGIASGALRGDELRSVLEQLPRVADVLAESLGVTRGELRDLGKDGKITGEAVIKAFTEVGDVLDDEFSKTEKTFAQGVTRLGDAFLQFSGTIGEIVGPVVFAVLDGITNRIKEVDRALQEIQALAGGSFAGPKGFRSREQGFLRGLGLPGSLRTELGVPLAAARNIAQEEFGERELRFRGNPRNTAGRRRVDRQEFNNDLDRIEARMRALADEAQVIADDFGVSFETAFASLDTEALEFSADKLQELIQKEKEAAEAAREMAKATNEAAVQMEASWEDLGVDVNGVKQGLKDVTDDFKSFNVAADITSSAARGIAVEFSGVVRGIKSAGDAFEDFGRRFVDIAADIVAQMLAMRVISGVATKIGPSIGGLGGILGGVLGFGGAGGDPGWSAPGQHDETAHSGGIFQGPASGFNVRLHGREAVIPLGKGSKMSELPMVEAPAQPVVTNNNITINAIDSKSFDDRFKDSSFRNRQFVAELTSSEARNNPALTGRF